ncbi:MAG: DsbA family protein [Gammaproteobacteria bacterium]|nr:DsbA family protein [Gammaproteobacteria bacterium]
MPSQNSTLYYIHDPMCSWCWAFHPNWQALKQSLLERHSGRLTIAYSLGSLAADSQDPMPEAMQKTLQAIWKNIQRKVPNTEFNFDFWTNCQPRRFTYPACRAVIAASQQGLELESPMILAIQTAYYLHAKNPSNEAELIEIAAQLPLDIAQFKQDLNTPKCQQILEENRQLNQRLQANSFPSLVLVHKNQVHPISIAYLKHHRMLTTISAILAT